MAEQIGTERDPRTLRLAEVDVDPSSYVDPHGFLFRYSDRLLRCVHGEAADRFRRLLDDGTLAALTAEGRLVETTRAGDLCVAEYPGAVVLEHRAVEPVTYCTEWCPSMLRDAARLTLELGRDLCASGLSLQDAYPWNVLFDGARPVFVDVTSIVPFDPRALWPAEDQYAAFFERPLVLCGEGKGFAARSLLANNLTGIEQADFLRAISSRTRWSRPGYAFSRWCDRRLQRSARLKERVRAFAERAVATATAEHRRRYFERLLGRLPSIAAGRIRDPWARYYAEIPSAVDRAAKFESVRRILRDRGPESVLDLGSNTGVFSFEAARQGARVVAVDASEACVESIYAAAARDRAAITPIVADVLCPSSARGFMDVQYPGMLERISSEVVLCLGLMHHLHLTGRQSFERIARLLSAVTERTLVFEFVSLEDDNVTHLPQRREIGYDFDSVSAALARYFPRIDALPSDRETRALLVCRR